MTRPGVLIMRARASVAVALALAAIVSLHANPEPGTLNSETEAAPALSVILSRAAAYVRHFEESFAVVVADEFYRQDVDDSSVAARPGNLRSRRHRDIRSEVLFMWTPTDMAWLTVRNVLMFKDGGSGAWNFAGDSRERIASILGRTAADQEERFRTLAIEGARFNLGRAYRNVAMPTMTIQFVDERYQPRFEFTDEGVDTLRRIGATRKVTFVERTVPTVVRSAKHDVPASGAIWLLPDDGAVVRTQLELVVPPDGRDPALQATIDVDYRRDTSFGVWVPDQMTEHYREQVTYGERISCSSTYTNFRRYATWARVLPAK